MATAVRAERALTKAQVISELTKSPHGDLKQYLPVGRAAVREDAEFMAHLVAWNQEHGSIRDSKVALPVIALAGSADKEFQENARAHIALQDPRNAVRAFRFAHEAEASRTQIRGVLRAYLAAREANWTWWERTAVQHRASMKELYALAHAKPKALADEILFKGNAPKGTIFEAIRNLKTMPALEAAGTIVKRRIPFLIAAGAVGARMKEPEFLQALIESMTPTELVTNTKMLERYGLKTNPALRGAYEKALESAGKSKKQTFKATRAAGAVTDEKLKAKLGALQEKQIKALGGVDGNWLVLGDKSGSMEAAIETSRVVAATLAKMVKGSVRLVFFDVTPRHVDVTGKDYDEIMKATARIDANGGTSIGCGVQYAIDAKFDVDGIAIVSDAAENQAPFFADSYRRLMTALGKEVPVYLYKIGLNSAQLSWLRQQYGPGVEHDSLTPSVASAGIDMHTFDLGASVDYHSLPNIVATMRTNRYSLVDEIMASKLLTLDQALKRKES